MARDYSVSSYQNYTPATGNLFSVFDTDFDTGGTATDDGFWNVDDPFTDGNTLVYVGHYYANGHLFLVHSRPPGIGTDYVSSPTADSGDPGYPTNFNTDLPPLITTPLPVCFTAGSRIATPSGETAVEALQIGTLVRTTEGRAVPVKWIGRQTVLPLFGPAERLMPVRFAAGSLGDGLPHTDLTVTADHGMLVDGVICHAGALVNGTTITRVPLAEMGESYTVYHIETEAHEIILANGAPAETFIDNVSRRVFDNYAEFDALYGEVPEMVELDYPRAMSARQVPVRIRALLAHEAAA